jgi:serine/threonine protein kinase
MTPSLAATSERSIDGDALFAELLDQMGSLVEAGDQHAAESLIDAHPDYADRLRRVLPAIEALAVFDEPQQISATDSRNGKPATPEQRLGDFRIIREIGRGGMGVVYEAEQLSLGRRVALKVLTCAALMDARQLERFKNEARIAANLHHTHIVPVHAVGAERGVYYYAMQYIHGQDLADVIAASRDLNQAKSNSADVGGGVRNSTLRDQQAVIQTPYVVDKRTRIRTAARWAVSIADALAYAHSLGVLHRDIKPANLLVDEVGAVWITDFGLARLESAVTLTFGGDVLGTLRYMSPELARGDHAAVNACTDIYALGVTLYELLTLRPAFEAADRRELFRQIADRDPRPLRQIDPAIPVDLETIVLKAMSKDAGGRYQTADAMAADLRRFLENKPIEARRPTFWQRGGKWVARHAAIAATAVGAVTLMAVVCAAAAAFSIRAYRAESRQRLAAEENLSVASESIDQMLSRVADDQYFHGELAHAEAIAADATRFYEKLLAHSDASELRFSAAQSYVDVADVWLLIDKPEKAQSASQRSLELLRPLITADSPRPGYLNARGAAHLALARSMWALKHRSDAEGPSQQAAADLRTAVDISPNEPRYKANLAAALNNLALLWWVNDHVDGAVECYGQVLELIKQLPPAFAEQPQVWDMHAGALSNWAMIERERGNTQRAVELLQEANTFLSTSLEKQPGNPVAGDFLYNHYWQLAQTSLSTGQPEQAARTVDALVSMLPARLDGYCEGVKLFLACADLAEKPPAEHDGVKGRATSTPNPSAVATYRQRARDLLAKARELPPTTPEETDALAWLLLTCRDKSLRDPSTALTLALRAVDEAPTRSDLWLTLALAHYRLGDWQKAEGALHKSTELTGDGAPRIRHWLLEAMIRFQQGRGDEARQLRMRAEAAIAKNHTTNEYTLALAAEAAEITREH